MKKGSPTLIILLAIAFVAILSFLPLSKWSGGKIKDFSLISDILKEAPASIGDSAASGHEQIDPELIKAIEEDSNHTEQTENDSTAPAPIDTIIHEAKAPRQGELVVLEDYTASQAGLIQLKTAINSGQLARIAVVGDSYIEGDIFTQDLRELLQNAYGGQGVGYVNMHSDFPGFRRSVKQSGSGWKTHMANKKADRSYLTLSEQYATPSGNAASTYEGTKALSHTGEWSRSRFIFISPDNSIISVKTGESEWSERNIVGADSVQSIEIAGITSRLDIRTSSPTMIGLGVWLDGDSGISLDCMSSRGFSGITLTGINPSLCREMASIIDYNLIILEFGINAMSSTQTNYTVYSNRMVNVINHVRRCYPHADIIVMGVGDRGEKRGGVVRSMATAPAMINAQRDAARRAHCMFWDTREAMGGEDAVVEWSNAGLINKDYIHMTHKGGARLAEALFKAIQHSMQ